MKHRPATGDPAPAEPKFQQAGPNPGVPRPTSPLAGRAWLRTRHKCTGSMDLTTDAYEYGD